MMSYSALTSPHTYMNAYSFIPLRINDTNAGDIEAYKYVINILYNKLEVTGSTSVSYFNNVFTQFNYASAHEYDRGDILFLNDSSNDYTNYYTVMSVPSSTSVILDLVPGAPITGSVQTANVIKYKFSPSPDGDAKFDLSNTIKDFVSQNLQDVNEIYAGPDTRFDYDIVAGYEGKAIFEFYDNTFVSGNVGFVNSGLTAVTQVDFQVGDEIIIQQDLYEWNYTDNYFAEGYLAFTGTSSNIFFTGDTVTVAGQITQPYYNGETTVVSAGTNYVVVNKTFTTSTPVEGGTIYGVPVPEYNTTATITDIYYSAGTGVVIVTDIGFAQNTPAIGGTIKHADGRIINSFTQLELTGFSAYNSFVNHFDYSITEFDKYVCQVRTSTANNISTILGGTSKFRIEESTKSWLLAHGDNLLGFPLSPRYTFYNAAGTLLSVTRMTNTSGYDDFYFPIGIDQILQSTNLVTTSGSDLSAITNSVAYYKVEVERLASVASNPVWFELNDDCSRYELYHLTWKDARGSWISYPFKYLSQDTIDVDRKNYYQTAGNWNNNSFDFDSFDRGDRTFFARSRKKVKINSGWIKEYENDLIEDMMKSAAVYLQLPDGTLVGATIDEKQITLGKNLNEQIWNYTFTVIYSLDEIRL
jgi:hypothetical protein